MTRIVDQTAFRLICSGDIAGYDLLNVAEQFDVPLVIPAAGLEVVTREAFGLPDSVSALQRIDATLGFTQVSIDPLDQLRALQVAEVGSSFTARGTMPVAELPVWAHTAVCAYEHDCPVVTADPATWAKLAPDVQTVEIG